ncbi:MAG: zinc-ribbon domain-containing protein [Deltaproteobacteria bacterium]|nr:zinc-ribbon domain-containing protein [Deltaproteobacteria bacterium]
MKIECPTCHKVYNIPEERLGSKDSVAFPCPACKGTIEIRIGAESVPEKPTNGDGEDLKKRILKSVGVLPPMPQTFYKAREIMNDPNSSFDQLADILEADPAIAAQVLKMANSPYYGMSGKVSSIHHASVVLGQKTLGELINMAGASQLLGNTLEGYELDSEDVWRHSMGVAFGSKMIANKKNPALADDAFAAGLLHDVGKLILDPYVLKRKASFKAFMADQSRSFLDAEKEILGFDHSEIASEVCKTWNVPESLATAIRCHHFPSQTEDDKLTYIVHMADATAMMTGLGLGIDGILYQMDDRAAAILGLKEEDISETMIGVVEAVENLSTQIQ